MRNPRFSFAAGGGFDVVLSASPGRDLVKAMLDLNKPELPQVQVRKFSFRSFRCRVMRLVRREASFDLTLLIRKWAHIRRARR
jgi:hypothetical protein